MKPTEAVKRNEVAHNHPEIPDPRSRTTGEHPHLQLARSSESTAENLRKQSRKVDSLVKGLKIARFKDTAMTTEQLGNHLANTAEFIQGEFRLDKRSSQEYVLMISKLAYRTMARSDSTSSGAT